ncbi:MAG: LysM peptidoglycan-binding domain-containing protein [Spirosomataceae bacterium]|jgi:LysM repeat protein
MKLKPRFILSVVTVGFLSGANHNSYAFEIAKDSVGFKREGVKNFVLYKVEAKQTLYSIVKRYGATVGEYKAANPGASDVVQIGQVLKVPYRGVVKQGTPSPKVPSYNDQNETVNPTEGQYEPVKMVTHVVGPGQTLFGVATKHKVTLAELRKWNNLNNDKLEVGQVLIVDAKEYERAKAANQLPKDNELIKINPETNQPEPYKESDVKPSTEVAKTASGYKKVIQTGLAELIDVEDKSGKYLALHRTAPVGTLINVKNFSNGQSIWVKVIGKLPPGAANDKVIIKLSPKAFEKLNPIDNRIRAELNYMIQ